MNDQFRDLLHSRAAHVKDTPLSAGAIRTGRRLKHLRKAATAAVAVAVAAGTVSGYLAFKSGDATALPADIGDTAVWTAIPDSMTYKWDQGYDAIRVSGGASDSIELPYSDSQSDAPQWQISPDGGSVSVVDDAGLRIGVLDGSRPEMVYEDPDLCKAQNWSPDGAKVLVGRCTGTRTDLVIVDADSGDRKVIEDVGAMSSATWTADGSQLVWGDPEAGYTISDSSGRRRDSFDAGQVSQDPADYMYGEQTDKVVDLGVTGVSADGRYVCHSVYWGRESPGGDLAPVSNHACDALIDTTTGQTARLSADEVEWFGEAVFSPGGGVLARGRHEATGQFVTVLFDKDFKVIDTLAEGEATSNSVMGSYTP